MRVVERKIGKHTRPAGVHLVLSDARQLLDALDHQCVVLLVVYRSHADGGGFVPRLLAKVLHLGAQLEYERFEADGGKDALRFFLVELEAAADLLRRLAKHLFGQLGEHGHPAVRGPVTDEHLKVARKRGGEKMF